MRVFMKPSNPTFGTKLFVSLVLLAISLCLVRCAGDKSTPVTVEEKELTVTSAALASKITQILGKKVPVKQPAALYEGFKLEEIIPTGTISTTFKPSQVAPATPGAPITEYEFAIPAGKTIKDYVQAALKDFTTEGKTKEQIKDDLKARFDKTSAEYGIKNEEEKITIQMTVPELEKFFYENFKDEKKIEQLPSTSPKQTLPANDKGLFASMFGTATPPFDFTVYVPKNSAGTPESVKAFCKACVDAVTTATTTPAPELADANAAHKALLNQVLTSLKAPKDADVEAIKYSVLIKGFEEYGFNATNKKIEAVSTTATKFTADNFKYADIVKPETFLNKFFYSFGEFDSTKSMPRNEIFLDYLLEVNKKSSITGTDFQEVLSKLLKAVETDLADTSSTLKRAFKAATDSNAINFFLRSIKISKDELQKSMEEIAVAKFQFKVAPEDIKVPTEKTPFTAVTAPAIPSVKCAKFPRKSTDTASADIDLIKSYVEFVVKLVDEKKKSEVDFSKDAHDKIKTEFFKAFWDEAVFAEYGKQLLTPANTATPDGGEGNGQGGSQQGDDSNTKPEKEGLSNLTIILICIGGAAVLIAIALGIYYKFYAGKESSEL